MVKNLNTPAITMTNEEKINIGRISAIKNINTKMSEFTAMLHKLEQPIFTDKSLLPTIYKVYRDYFARRGNVHDADLVRNRKKFLLIVLYLYSPRTLSGRKMQLGLRRQISNVIGLTSSTPISDNCVGLITLYNAYIDFKNDVDAIYSDVIKTLGVQAVN